MMTRFFASMICAVFLPFAALAGDDVVQFGQQDPEMQSAIAEARSSLPQFLANTQGANGQSIEGAGLKVEFNAESEQSEVIWIVPFAPRGEGFVGILANEPNSLPGKNAGDMVEFSEAQIADWTYSAEGKLFGNYTTRVMLPHLDEATQTQLSQILSDTPVPTGW